MARGRSGNKIQSIWIRVEGSVEFKHIRFGYEPDNPVIKDFSVKLNLVSRLQLLDHRSRQDHAGQGY